MHKYEIMAILNPKIDPKKYEDFLKKIFSTGIENTKKLEITELAYKINNSKTGTYMLSYVKTTGDKLKTFNRKANFDKDIWRTLIINLDKEMKKNKEKKLPKHKIHLSSNYVQQTKDKDKKSESSKNQKKKEPSKITTAKAETQKIEIKKVETKKTQTKKTTTKKTDKKIKTTDKKEKTTDKKEKTTDKKEKTTDKKEKTTDKKIKTADKKQKKVVGKNE